MRFPRTLRWLVVVTAVVSGCPGPDGVGPSNGGAYRGQHVHTLLMGASDNAEVVKIVPGLNLAILVSSKGREITLLQIVADRLVVLREVTLFEGDPTESELTHVDVNSDGSWAVVTRTILVTGTDGEQVDCGGELVFLDVTDSESFGLILGQIDVGPMPDSVDVSDDDRLVVSADERDGPDAWGKCEVPGEVPSISVLDLASGPEAATLLFQIEMIDGDGGPREPESVVFSADNDLVAATLQDSHELALLRVSELRVIADPTTDDVTIVPLPPNLLGAGPWPDGVARFTDGEGRELFATAGEWNDTFTVLEQDGSVVATVDLSSSDVPASLPRVVEEGSPLFSPDSIAAFVRGGSSYLAFTLRHAGAVAVYDVTDPYRISYVTAIPVGHDEGGGIDAEGSTVRPEGIGAAADGSFLVVANEAESSVSLIVPAE